MTADLESKRNKRQLRELAGIAYQRELGAELAKLEAEFARWRSGEIDPFELSDRIHQFHDGAARDLYVLYGRVHSTQTVARAVACQILQEDEVPAELLDALARSLQFYREQMAEPGEPAEA